MRRVLLFTALLTLAPLALAAPAESHLVWAGPIHHDLVYRPSAYATIYRAVHGEPGCHGDGIGVVEIDLAAGTLKLVNPDDACIPGFSTMSEGCRLDEDGHVRCARDVGNDRIRADVAPDGAFLFTWDAFSFNEVITGTLTRVH